MVALSGKQDGSTWALAPSLCALVFEVDDRWPGRSKIADGSIGDSSHQSRESDHNPSGGWVHAVDLTHDPAHGMPGPFLVESLLHDPRVNYLIHNHQVWRSYAKPGIAAWTPAPYTGASAHEHHVHVSIVRTDKARQDTSRWLTEGDEVTDADIEKLRKVIREEVVFVLNAHAKRVSGISGDEPWDALLNRFDERLAKAARI